MLFYLLTLWAYTRYVETGAASRSQKSEVPSDVSDLRPLTSGFYRLALLFFVLALMSKPMAVTLPFVLLLLDYWPMQRVLGFRFQVSGVGADSSDRIARTSPAALVAEKLPFFALTLATCVITMVGRSKAQLIAPENVIPWGLRLANVPVSYAQYVWKLFWPVDLCVLYPMPSHWKAWQVGGALALLLLITLIALFKARSAPYLIVGWSFFLGTLVPTLGLVQVGNASIADRFTYLPCVGLFVAVLWLMTDVSRHWRSRGVVLGALAILGLLACGALTWLQVQTWRNSGTLWRQCLKVYPENAIAHYNLGHFLQHSGKATEAITEYREVLRVKPNHLDAHLNLGVVYVALGQIPEATNWFAKALQIKPDYANAHLNMGLELYKLKDFRGATNHMEQVLRVNPNSISAHGICALALLELSDVVGAMNHATAAAQLAPNDYGVFTVLGRAYSASGQSEEAMANFAEALRLNPNYAEARRHLGVEWLKRGELEMALTELRQAVRLDPDSAEAHQELGMALAGSRATGEAIAEYREALKRDPNLLAALNNLAWILATHPDDQLRDGKAAVKSAERACVLTADQQPMFIGTLAAAYAEAGQFDKAVATAQKASEVALALGQTNLSELNQKLLRQYRERQPYRDGN